MKIAEQNHNLFEYLSTHHGLMLLESELEDVLRAVAADKAAAKRDASIDWFQAITKNGAIKFSKDGKSVEICTKNEICEFLLADEDAEGLVSFFAPDAFNPFEVAPYAWDGSDDRITAQELAT